MMTRVDGVQPVYVIDHESIGFMTSPVTGIDPNLIPNIRGFPFIVVTPC